jgi:hypothetical protein
VVLLAAHYSRWPDMHLSARPRGEGSVLRDNYHALANSRAGP